MLDVGKKVSRGRRKNPIVTHSVPLVEELLKLTDGHKDYWLVEEAKLSRSYLSNIRSNHIGNPGIKNLMRIAKALGFNIVLEKEQTK